MDGTPQSIARMESEHPEGESPNRKEYELELMRLQIEMLKLQLWVLDRPRARPAGRAACLRRLPAVRGARRGGIAPRAG